MRGEEQVAETPTQQEWLGAVVDYYEQTRFDYWAVWYNPDNFAFHFGYYDESIVTHHQALNNTNRVLAGIASVAPGDRVLDAGCGLGSSSFWLARHRRAHVVGVTPVAHQVKKAKDIAKARGLNDRVEFHVADYTRTPFGDGSFDVVWALESLCHATDKAAFYREAARLLRPGGRLVVAEYMRTTRELDPEAKSLMRDWLDGWLIPDLNTRDEHLADARAAGLSDLQVLDNTRHANRSLRRLYKLAVLAWPVNTVFHRLGLRSKTQYGNVVASLIQYQLLRQGAWFYGILSAVKW
jgi:cyclopropane fatty-acyl-phospholipid synthase-like methyltransferase